jgi:hypothetical protein
LERLSKGWDSFAPPDTYTYMQKVFKAVGKKLPADGEPETNHIS